MNDRPSDTPGDLPPEERLERLLRTWGAEESAEQADIGDAPLSSDYDAATGRPHRPTSVLWRWLPVAAGFVLLAGAALLFALAGLQSVASTKQVQEIAERNADLEQLLDDASTAIDQLKGAVEKRNEDLAKMRTAYQQKIDAQTETLSALDQRVTELERESRQREARYAAAMAEAQEALTAAEKGRDAARAELVRVRSALADVETKSSAELAALRQKAAGLDDELGRARRQLAAAEARYRDAISAAVQTQPEPRAAGALLDRLPALRRRVRGDSTVALLGSLEVTLTRLVLAEPRGRAAIENVAATARRLDLSGRIDEALLDASEPADIRRWLAEARILLAGVTDVY